jgi:hypothetical protein
MAGITGGDFADVVEGATSPQAGELSTKSAEAYGTQTKSRQRAEKSSQDFPIDGSPERLGKPTRRKNTKKAAKRTPQAAQASAPPNKSAEETITLGPQATNNASAPAFGTARTDFVADPKPVLQGSSFLCTFTLSRPGLVGLNKLAIFLNDLQDSGSIAGWQAKGWEDAATKVRTFVGFANRADAIIAIGRSSFSQ